MQASNDHILVFDSGVGGLSIIGHLRQQLPQASICYLADNAMHPYGLLDESVLINRVLEVVAKAIAQQQPDIVVIACNSASTLVLPHLRAQFSMPIVGVVPAIKPAALHSESKVIGLLATPGTIARDYTDELINDFAIDCDVIRLGTNKLVQLVEQKLAGEKIALAAYQQVLEPFAQHPLWPQADTVVLACTHFPLVKNELATALPHIKYWIDSGEAIARRVLQLRQTAATEASTQKSQTSATPAGDIALLTENGSVPDNLRQTFKNYGFEQINGL
ncbi:glutamate racemase [Oceanicoccus sp. KOV_DT_Chl]|uniref:glutamate racemase n=1 Tax=Oceanicoccus sp. KOV_DT_Chl TaxID=1904639 RepID=UPI000C79916A|nr:glutamate racemase [Oceanicoccus sp. KOV_DT_Chl]